MSIVDSGSQEKTSPSGTQAVHSHTDSELQVACEPAVDEAPDGGYGWIVVVAIVFMNAATWGPSAGVQTASSLLIPHRIQHIIRGVSRPL
jgi:hypothetical protein